MKNTIGTIQLALISHTNNGKTTLARTLLGLDVGEVRDAAHVTTFTNAYPLLVTPEGDALQLWDTPGFGDSVRLLTRINIGSNPIGWFLREVFDRYRDRVFWLSQQAMRTTRESADVVLYLVNSSEHPNDAAYLVPELKILEWLGKPVLVLLNQVGEPRPASEEAAEQARWRHYFERFPIVHGVLAMDAFARCWVHEHVFYEEIERLIPDQQKGPYQRLRALWEANNEERFQRAMAGLSELLLSAAKDSEVIEGEVKSLANSALSVVGIGRKGEQQRQEKAMATLTARLNLRIDEATSQLLSLHRLDPGERKKINERLREHFVIREPVDQAKASLLGAIAAGATTGISADLLSGGLTLGGGVLLGGLFGALTFAGVAWTSNAYNDRHEPIVQFSNEALNEQLVTSVLLYLAVAHFGRGRGNFAESEAPAFWREAVQSAMQPHADELAELWGKLRSDQQWELASDRLKLVVVAITRRTLERLYPAARPADGD